MPAPITAGTTLFMSNPWDKHGEYPALFSTEELAAENALEVARSIMRDHGDDDALSEVDSEKTVKGMLEAANECMASYDAGVEVYEMKLEA